MTVIIAREQYIVRSCAPVYIERTTPSHFYLNLHYVIHLQQINYLNCW